MKFRFAVWRKHNKACFPASTTLGRLSVVTWWTFVSACPPASVKGVNLRHTNSRTRLMASKVAAWCLTEQRVSLVVPVSGSLSCQADLRWQTCGRAVIPREGNVSSARCFSCTDTRFTFYSFLTDRVWRLLFELRTEQEWLEIIIEGHLEFMHECVWMHNR